MPKMSPMSRRILGLQVGDSVFFAGITSSALRQRMFNPWAAVDRIRSLDDLTFEADTGWENPSDHFMGRPAKKGTLVRRIK